MRQLLLHRALRIGFVLLVLCSLSSVALATPLSQEPANTYTIYLPLIQHRSPSQTVFGIEMGRISAETGLDLVLTSGTRWIRRNALIWKVVEPVEDGGYQWDSPAMQDLEAEMLEASRQGLKLIMVVRGSPRWATAPYEADCAPINPAKVDAFARFMAAAVERYSRPPYNLIYWEIGNEPDAPIFPNDSVFGCWGLGSDPYYGGRAYGEMLKKVSAAMKAANPNIKVLNGGLLLDRAYQPGNLDTLLGRFFEGILAAGAGASFDLLSFHSYTFYKAPGAPPLGDSVDWRIKYLTDLQRAYNVPPKPMLRTETALLCAVLNRECRWAQADFLVRSYVYALRDGLLANIWYVYDNDSYHNTALIEPGDVFVPRPAYFAYRHAARMLSGADYLGPLGDQPPGVEGYRLRNGARTIVVVWSDQGGQAAIPAPAGATVECSNRDGGAISCAAGDGMVRLNVQSSPIYVVIR